MNTLDDLLKVPINNFSLLISELIKCESEDRDDDGWDIVYKIETLDDEVNLLIHDFLKRNLENEEECLLYSSLWASMLNNDVDYMKMQLALKSLSNLDRERIFKYFNNILMVDVPDDTKGVINAKKMMSYFN